MTMIQASDISGILPEVIAFRRELHQWPELSGEEKETRDRLLRELKKTDCQIQLFDHHYGIMAVMKNGHGRCMAVRADMDALPVQEATGLSFESRHPGVMHACGHDVHMALALGSALYLDTHRDQWQGEVRFLFEPQEETVGGARFMAEAGCMDQVDCIIGQHVNPSYPAGTYFCKPGFVSGSSDEVEITVRGTACHGAYPERGVDAILIAANMVTALQSLVSRHISPFDSAVLTLGTIQGGKAKNIVCDQVCLGGTLRTLRNETRKDMQEGIRRICHSVAEAFGGSAEVVIRPGYGAVYNSDRYYPVIEQVAQEVFGMEHMVHRENPSLGVESMFYFMEKTDGVYYDIGSGVSTALHTSTMTIDENCISAGLRMQISSLLTLLGGHV